MTSTYHPISCALHGEYELAIMRQAQLELVYIDDQQSRQTVTVLPVDLETRQHAEYLLVKTQGDLNLRIRLDHILEMRMLQK